MSSTTHPFSSPSPRIIPKHPNLPASMRRAIPCRISMGQERAAQSSRRRSRRRQQRLTPVLSLPRRQAHRFRRHLRPTRSTTLALNLPRRQTHRFRRHLRPTRPNPPQRRYNKRMYLAINLPHWHAHRCRHRHRPPRPITIALRLPSLRPHRRPQ
jgi:hypothetical protein